MTREQTNLGRMAAIREAAKKNIELIREYMNRANSEGRIEYSLYCGVIDNLPLAEILLDEDIATLAAALDVERGRAEAAVEPWSEVASDNTDYVLLHMNGIYSVTNPDGDVVCEFLRGPADTKGGQGDDA